MKDLIKTSWQTARTFLPASLIALFLIIGLTAGIGVFASIDSGSGSGVDQGGVYYPEQEAPDMSEQIEAEGTVYAGPQEYTLQHVIKILGEIRDFILVLGIIFIVIMIVWAGISYVMAGGDEEGTEAAKSKLIGALIGAAIILAAFALIATVSNLIESRSLIETSGS